MDHARGSVHLRVMKGSQTSTKIVLDSFALIEYLEGSVRGKRVKDLIENNKDVFINIISIAEVVSVLKRKGFYSDDLISSIAMFAKIYQGDFDFYRESGLLHALIKQSIRDFGLADTIVLLTARKLNAKIVTGDPHFKTFKEAILI